MCHDMKQKKMVRPRGLDKAAEPLQSQPVYPAGNPLKKSPRKRRILSAFYRKAAGIM